MKLLTDLVFNNKCEEEDFKMSGNIETICQQLGSAVELTMNPAVPMEQRHQVGGHVMPCDIDWIFTILGI